VHTFKGLFNQFSFLETPVALHALESRLEVLRQKGNEVTRRHITDEVLAWPLAALLEADLALLREALGAEFVELGERIIISSEQAVLLKQFAIDLLRGASPDTTLVATRALLLDISRLKKISLRAALASFDRLIRQTAERLDKEVTALQIEGGADVWVEPQIWQPFLRSLTHVFRNAVVHGIESPGLRLALNKNEAGAIVCKVRRDGSEVQLSILDDGAGIDVEALRQRALSTGRIAAAELANLTLGKVMDLIFLDNISTQQEASELAGRGVGLAVVRNETRKLGGEVLVQSTPGQGTRFEFTLPLQCDIFDL
jgi:two-component system chemotaxis sensor kinase CheA